MQTREEAQQALDAALSAQREARKRLDTLAESVRLAKADAMEADGKVTLARAALSRFAPAPSTGNGKGGDHSAIRAAVTNFLTNATEPQTVDQILDALATEGLTLQGKNPRANLQAYLSRWDGITSDGRGKYTVPKGQPEVPPFLAPTPVEPTPAQVPQFLTPTGTDAEYGGEPLETTDAVEGLPTDFPGYDALIAAGYLSRASLEGKTHDQLRRIKGVGAETARNILAALEA